MKVKKQLVSKISALALGVLLTSNVNAQYSYGTISGVGNTRGQDITKDGSAIYVSGTFLGTGIFPATGGNINTASSGGDAAYATNINLTGNPNWVNWDIATGGTSEGMTCSVEELSGDDEFFVSGRATGSVDWLALGVAPGGSGTFGSGPFPITGYYVTCLDKNTGNHRQTFDVPPVAGYNTYQVRSMTHTRRTVGVQVFYDIYICGVAQQAFPSAPAAFVTCVSYHANTLTFSHIWTTMATQASFSSSQALDIIWNPCSNNLAVTGDFVSKIGFIPGSIACTSPASREAWFCQFNAGTGSALGNTFRAAGTNAGQSSQGTGLIYEPAGGIDYTGWFTGNIANLFCVGNNNTPMVGAGAIAAPPGVRRSFVTLQNCATGGFPWKTVITSLNTPNYGTNEASGITHAAGAGTNLYIYGRFNTNSINLPGAFPYTGTIGGGEFRSFVCDINALTGVILCGNVTTAPSASGSDHQPTEIVEDAGSLYSTGRFKGQVNYFVSSGGPTVLGSVPGIYETMVTKNNASSCDFVPRPSEATGISEAEISDKSVSIFPNPATDKINLNITDLKGDVKLTIFDQKGSLVKEETISQMNNEIDMSKLSPGLYLVKVKGDNIDHSQKIIKQ